jgi:hypothetical protein
MRISHTLHVDEVFGIGQKTTRRKTQQKGNRTFFPQQWGTYCFLLTSTMDMGHDRVMAREFRGCQKEHQKRLFVHTYYY